MTLKICRRRASPRCATLPASARRAPNRRGRAHADGPPQNPTCRSVEPADAVTGRSSSVASALLPRSSSPRPSNTAMGSLIASKVCSHSRLACAGRRRAAGRSARRRRSAPAMMPEQLLVGDGRSAAARGDRCDSVPSSSSPASIGTLMRAAQRQRVRLSPPTTLGEVLDDHRRARRDRPARSAAGCRRRTRPHAAARRRADRGAFLEAIRSAGRAGGSTRRRRPSPRTSRCSAPVRMSSSSSDRAMPDAISLIVCSSQTRRRFCIVMRAPLERARRAPRTAARRRTCARTRSIGIEPLDGGGHRRPLGHHDDFRVGRQPLELGSAARRRDSAPGARSTSSASNVSCRDQLERARHASRPRRRGTRAHPPRHEHAREVAVVVDDQHRSGSVHHGIWTVRHPAGRDS